MQSDDKDSLSKLIDDVEQAAVCGACTYFGRQGVHRCDGCPAYMDDDPCTQSVLDDVARRLHALMPHDADGREIKVGDTVKNLHGQFKDVEVTEIRSIPFGDELANARSLNAPVTYPTNWRVVQPDSWERLEADATLLPHDYLTNKDASDKRYGIEAMTAMAADLVCRAKALAGVE
nr:MAG TPA: hypothetical protein [Caudoviricetes sp.]